MLTLTCFIAVIVAVTMLVDQIRNDNHDDEIRRKVDRIIRKSRND